jgi:hypothetical protein
MYKIGIYTKENFQYNTDTNSIYTKEYRTVTYVEEKPLEVIEKMVKCIYGMNSEYEILEKIK